MGLKRYDIHFHRGADVLTVHEATDFTLQTMWEAIRAGNGWFSVTNNEWIRANSFDRIVVTDHVPTPT